MWSDQRLAVSFFIRVLSKIFLPYMAQRVSSAIVDIYTVVEIHMWQSWLIPHSDQNSDAGQTSVCGLSEWVHASLVTRARPVNRLGWHSQY